MSSEYKVWSRFHVTRKDGSVVKLRIQDLEWDKHKEVILDFMMKYFITDEAFHKAAGIGNNEEAKTDYKEIFYILYGKNLPHISGCCIDDGSQTNDIVGVSIISDIKTPSEVNDLNDIAPRTKEVQNLFRIIEVVKDMKVSKDYESFYEGRGISVRPDYRGFGIANEFVRLRKQICIENDVQMTCAWMTSIGTQKAADKYNWKTSIEVPVEEFKKKTGLPFADNIYSFKLMYTTKD